MTDMDLSEEKTNSQYEQLIPQVENVAQKSTDIEDNTRTTEESFIQAQTPLYNRYVYVNLQKQLYVKMSVNGKIYDCIKIGNTLVLTDYKNTKLIICNSDGTDIHHISLPDTPNNITEVTSNTVAVSCRYDRTILIINISTRSITSTINTSGYCYGISYNDNKLYVVIDSHIIHVMDLTGKVKHIIPLPSHHIDDITVDRDRLVCINYESIFCCSMKGKLIWKFKTNCQDFRRATTDDEGNVYVTDGITHKVVVVSNDGKLITELINSSDGMNRRSGINFDKKENILFVCNDRDGKAFLFDVKHVQKFKYGK